MFITLDRETFVPNSSRVCERYLSGEARGSVVIALGADSSLHLSPVSAPRLASAALLYANIIEIVNSQRLYVVYFMLSYVGDRTSTSKFIQ